LRWDGYWEEEVSQVERRVPGQVARLILDMSVLQEMGITYRRSLKIQSIKLGFTVSSEKLIALMFTNKGMCFKTGAELERHSIHFRKEKIRFCGIKSTVDKFAIDIIYTPTSMNKY
jgi:hypothetical protein